MNSRWLKCAGLRWEEKCTYSYILNKKVSGKGTPDGTRISLGDNTYEATF
jgi:hypothetical protein